MPALGSSVINKSGKKFAPKAPIRRPVTTSSTHVSTRASVERSQPSPIPQTESSQQAADLPNLAPSQSQLAETQETASDLEPPQEHPDHTEKGSQDTFATQQDATNTRFLGHGPDTCPPQTTIRSHPLKEQPNLRSTRITPEVSYLGQPNPVSSHAAQSPIHTANIENPEELSPNFPSRQAVTPPANSATQDEQTSTQHADAPPRKRRKLIPDRFTKPTASQAKPGVQIQVPTCPTEDENNRAATADQSRTGNLRTVTGQVASITELSRGKRSKQRTRAAGNDELSESNRDSTRPMEDAQPRAKVGKPRKSAAAARVRRLQQAAAEIVADAAEGTTTSRKGRRVTKAREPTPEEAENETIAPGVTKMVDLCKDTRKGKKSDMLKALQEHDREAMARKAQEELQHLVETGQPRSGEETGDLGGPGGGGSDGQAPAEDVTERQEDVIREVADTYVDEHGQIRINTDSLRIDRHAQAAAAREQGQQETVVENDLSRPAINSATYAKREKLNSWPEAMTDEFYEALQIFGTDFGMIGRMLRRTRRAVKLKFNREERLDPARINQALLGARIAVDVEEYSRRVGEDIKETEEHERDMEEDRKKIEEHAADELRAKEEQEQLRREEIEQERAAVPDDSSEKENREASQKQRKRKKTEGAQKAKAKEKSRKRKGGKVAAEVP
ncbi:MAG: hypothetical protein Q9219_001739 [cf. Caloplaca sp. 3 TL-2023]